MKPIVLTTFGETLLEYPTARTEKNPNEDNSEHDARKLIHCIGIHEACNGWVDIRKVSKTHNALICRQCGLRVVVPNQIGTYGELRQYMA